MSESPLDPCDACGHARQDHYVEFCAACPASRAGRLHPFRKFTDSGAGAVPPPTSAPDTTT